nr:MAG TPA: hypothetical protein [Caudoviricetes sp.]
MLNNSTVFALLQYSIPDFTKISHKTRKRG